MALTKIGPVEAHVRWDRRRDHPDRIRWGNHEARVVRLAAVRDELAAYPADQGPRITYLLETDDGGQTAVVFDPRLRRWFVEAVDQAA
jgi:hypothetical protein